MSGKLLTVLAITGTAAALAGDYRDMTVPERPARGLAGRLLAATRQL